jgi:hypothetical protein
MEAEEINANPKSKIPNKNQLQKYEFQKWLTPDSLVIGDSYLEFVLDLFF